MSTLQAAKMKAKENISMPMVVSSALGVLAAGVALYAAGKSGIGPLKKAAKVASGGKK